MPLSCQLIKQLDAAHLHIPLHRMPLARRETLHVLSFKQTAVLHALDMRVLNGHATPPRLLCVQKMMSKVVTRKAVLLVNKQFV